MGLAAESLQPSGKRILSIGDLTRRIKETLEDSIQYVWVTGEISNFKGAGPSGHLYFTLKDEESQIPCAMWRGSAARLRYRVENGLEVIAGGRVEVYLPHGKYQLIVDQMEPKGVGALQLRFEQLKEKLQKEGLFDPARKRPLPFLPRKLALVTSPTGAAVQDMLRTIRSRCPAIHVVVYPVKVQGDGAAEEIAAAIGHLNLAMPEIDVMIVGRGGGSIEDLWAFNEEVVARAIHSSRIPVVSAVGHETDTTIADFVADVRALTPTDGAVRATPKLEDLELTLESLDATLRRSLRATAELTRSRLDGLREGRVLGRIQELPAQLAQRIDELAGRLEVALGQASRHLRERLERMRDTLVAGLPRLPEAARQEVRHLSESLQAQVRRATDLSRARLREGETALQALNPLAILGRGYSVTRLEETGQILTDPSGARPGDRIITRLAKGDLRSTVEGTESTTG
jgi:exodeoxyribonuclease VII large subunit